MTQYLVNTCQYKDSISFKVIQNTKDISLEMNIMEDELKENESICFENCCRLELMNPQNVPK